MRGAAGAFVVLAATAVATGSSYAHPLGHTTEDHTIEAGPPIKPGSTFETLEEGPGRTRVVRALPGTAPLPDRASRRSSLSYFAQLTDFQLVDEESPARVEFVDRGPSSAWRPQEAFHPWAIDFSFRQLNQFTGASPHTQAGGARAAMDLGLLTGDQSDNQQRNETVWVRQLIEGGTPLTPNSGMRDYTDCRPQDRLELETREATGELPDEPIYMGVQDYDDLGFQSRDYYDPDEPFGDQFGTWPMWPGLMDRAQSRTFTPVGLRRGDTPVPTYIANGNHDGLVQGNEDAIRTFEDIATGCFKAAPQTGPPPSGTQPSLAPLLSPLAGFAVRPDNPGRSFVDRVELKRIYSEGIQPDDHGFAYVDGAELVASAFSATYWARDLKPGIRFVSIDTVSDGGVTEESSSGNIDDPQWRWLQRELDAARRAGKLIVVFGHHPVRSLSSNVPDEAAQPCTGRYDASGSYGGARDEHGHDPNPGCDLDPRPSTPIHQGEDLAALLDSNPNVIAYVAGHTHENKVLACGREGGCPAGGNWWEINTSAGAADWPQQSRLIELMDNGDGTLSLFGTLTDFAAPLPVPAPDTPAAGFGDSELGSISHAIAFNDPQVGDGAGEGAAQDQNVELVVDDPRSSRITGSAGRDVIRGTPGDDLIICGPGDDVVIAGDGDDVIRCGPGDDLVRAGRGRDRVSGGADNDRLFGQPGRDRVFGRTGRDRVLGQGAADFLAGGAGRDRMSGGASRDRMDGGRANDRVGGGGGADRMHGRAGRDRMAGGAGNDRMRGGSGRDRMAGGRRNDRMRGGRGADSLFGGPGNDLLIGGPDRDRLSGGPGRDTRRQ